VARIFCFLWGFVGVCVRLHPVQFAAFHLLDSLQVLDLGRRRQLLGLLGLLLARLLNGLPHALGQVLRLGVSTLAAAAGSHAAVTEATVQAGISGQ